MHHYPPPKKKKWKNEYLVYDTKLHLLVRLQAVWSTLSLPLLPDPLWPGVVVPVRFLWVKQISRLQFPSSIVLGRSSRLEFCVYTELMYVSLCQSVNIGTSMCRTVGKKEKKTKQKKTKQKNYNNHKKLKILSNNYTENENMNVHWTRFSKPLGIKTPYGLTYR